MGGYSVNTLKHFVHRLRFYSLICVIQKKCVEQRHPKRSQKIVLSAAKQKATNTPHDNFHLWRNKVQRGKNVARQAAPSLRGMRKVIFGRLRYASAMFHYLIKTLDQTNFEFSRRCATYEMKKREWKWHKVGAKDRDGMTEANMQGGVEWRDTPAFLGLQGIL